MEDAHTHILALPEDKACAFLAVYDGHGGAKVALHSCKYLHTRIASQPDFSSLFPSFFSINSFYF
jgi:protein phosphatase 2C family protein 2/3